MLQHDVPLRAAARAIYETCLVDGDDVPFERAERLRTDRYRIAVDAAGDPAGTLVGYVAVKQLEDGVWLNSALTLGNTARGRVSCFIGGKLTSSETYEAMTSAEASRDFRARTGYAAWERSPGDWMVSPDDGGDELDSNPNAARGMWYLERKGNNLRIQQERWNYCYPDTSVQIDDVYRRVISLIKRPA